MSRDPYHDFALDLRQSLSSARSLSQAYKDQLASGSSHDQLQSAHDRLSDAIEGLRQDVEDVKQSVQVVQKSGPERFGVTPDELTKRKAFVKECEDEILQLSQVAKGKARAGYDAIDMQADQDATEAFEREQQQLLMSRQDNTLDKIGSTLANLQTQAGMMGQEIGEQIELIGTLDNEVDHSQGRLSKAMRQMDEVIRIGDERLGGWCVWILIVVLFMLLLMVILI